MNELMVTMVPTQYVWHVWYQVEPILKIAIPYTYGRLGINDAYREVLQNDQQLWIVKDKAFDKIIAAMTTKITKYPQCKMLSGILCAGGRMDEWISQMMEMMDIFGKENECRGFEVSGRAGWEKPLRKLNMKKRFTIMEKVY